MRNVTQYTQYFLIILLLGFFSACTPTKEKRPGLLTEPVAHLFDPALKPFYHGVASGDPLPDRVILWTRVTPNDSLIEVDVTWEVSSSPAFEPLIASGKLTTSPAKDYTVKVDVTGLQPNTFYHYRFHTLGATSLAGRTKTSSIGGRDSLSFAVVSCSNWEFGYFNAYEALAGKNLDAVLHLGDYIYEYGTGRYGDTTIGRINIPPYEIVTLQDYRTRHSQYRLDEGLRKASQMHPFITIWDDHEVANDSYADGAQNHQPEEGPYEARKHAAIQAYYEWLPIREGQKHYRAFSFGELADIFMLDERLEGRTKQANDQSDPDLLSETRTMLGQEQLDWLLQGLKGSKATWKVIGNQVIFSGLDESFNPRSKGTDNWNGYPVERKRIVDFIKQQKISDIIFLTGDTHASWAFEVAIDPTLYASKRQPAIAVEFGAPSVSSSNWDEFYPLDTARLAEQLYKKHNPHLKFVNGIDHGFTLLTLYPDRAVAQWHYVKTLREKNPEAVSVKTIMVQKGSTQLK